MSLNYGLSSDTWDENEIKAIERVISSNRYTMGAEVKKFESELAAMHGVRHAVMTNSGSSANLIMLAALALHPKYKKVEKPNVIVPAVSWSTTFFPVHQHGFELKFVDVELNTFNIDPYQVENAIDENTVAVLAVNLLGSCADYQHLKRICDAQDVVLLEDNCESFGAKAYGKMSATFGEMGTLSFFFSHHLQTMEGGCVFTNDDSVADYLRSLRAHGWVRDDHHGTFDKANDPFMDSFRFVLPGYCVRPLEFSGAVGQCQLKKWPEMLRMRRQNAKVAEEALNTKNSMLQMELGESSWFGFGIVLTHELEGKRKDVIRKLTDAGVECRPIVAGNFMRNPVIEKMNCKTIQAPNADYIHENGFFIGNDCIDLADKIRAVGEILRAY